MGHVWVKKVYLPQTSFFWEKLILFLSMYWPISLCKSFKNSCNVSRIMKIDHLCIQNWPICPNKNFFRKPDNKLSSYHSCLSTFQKSKSHISILMKYWRLRNTEISLAESHFWSSLETQIFPRHVVFAEW